MNARKDHVQVGEAEAGRYLFMEQEVAFWGTVVDTVLNKVFIWVTTAEGCPGRF